MNLKLSFALRFKLVSLFAAMLTICTTSHADGRVPDPNRNTLEQLAGEWELVGTEAFGERFPDSPAKAMIMKFEGKKMIIAKCEPFVPRGGAEGRDESTFEIDATVKPMNIDITNTTGAKKGQTSYAVFELMGDMLKIAASGFGARDGEKGNPKDRPASVEGKGPVMVMTFKRVKA